MENGRLKVVKIGEKGITEDDILIHDETEQDPSVHLSLINMGLPDFPVAFGVIRNVDAPAYDIEMENQIEQVQQTRKITCVDDLLNSGNTWEITGNGNEDTEECPDKKLE